MRQHKLFWGSSYDRGLKHLLLMWQEIITKFPDAELHICYGWDLFMIAHHNNPERMQWKQSVESLMDQRGIIHHGRVGQEVLSEIRKKCGIWSYPTDFNEINCITALQAQCDGLVPVVINKAALSETVQSGIKVDGEIHNPKTAQLYLQELLDIMGDQKRWVTESQKAIIFAKNYDWQTIAKRWQQEFVGLVSHPLVSIITPTIREGWWDLMAKNIASQTYKNDEKHRVEWLIVDDHKDDRKEIANKIADKYHLDIRYIRGAGSLAKANNIAMKEAGGELLIWLQDFITIPKTAIEDLVQIYKRNPTALIAPVDEYWFTITPNENNKEDWFGGKHPMTRLSWKNIRQQYLGLRKTNNPMDFELNFGAIPALVLKDLGGWYDEWDEKMGYDNTEIALRALMAGYKILVDDGIVATCLDIGGKTQGSVRIVPEIWDEFSYKLNNGEIPIKKV